MSACVPEQFVCLDGRNRARQFAALAGTALNLELHNRHGVTMTFNAGTRIGQYEIVAPLGQGGMGVVYRALDTKLQRPVAIKFLSEDVADARGAAGSSAKPRWPPRSTTHTSSPSTTWASSKASSTSSLNSSTAVARLKLPD